MALPPRSIPLLNLIRVEFFEILFNLQPAIDNVCQLLVPLEDSVFDLVPLEFRGYAGILYESMESLVINLENVWVIYCELLHQFEHLDNAVDFIEECQVHLRLMDEQDDLDSLSPPTGRELHGGPENPDTEGFIYMGGVNNGHGLDTELEWWLDRMDEDENDFEIIEVEFTDDESDGQDGDEW